MMYPSVSSSYKLKRRQCVRGSLTEPLGLNACDDLEVFEDGFKQEAFFGLVSLLQSSDWAGCTPPCYVGAMSVV